jgi:hypothetical protein
MLLGLLRWRFESGGGGSSVGRFLWTQVGLSKCYVFVDTLIISVRQGLIWIFLVTIAYIPPVVRLAVSFHLSLSLTNISRPRCSFCWI